jgi:acyl dehydratase
VKFGRYFEEFEVGATYRHWPGKTVTEADDMLFCALTMNQHPLHSDLQYAETKTQFKRNVAVGNYVYSLVLGMSVPDVSGKAIANLEIESLKHENPTFHGDTVYAETTVLDKKESGSKPDRGIVYVETRGFNQRGERVCVFRRRVMVPKREHFPDLQPEDLTPEQSRAAGLRPEDQDPRGPGLPPE